MSEFHAGKPWRKLSAEHKRLRCYDCGTTKDITSGHILAASQYKMFRLWTFNLCYQCMPCNLKLGTRTNWKHWKAPIIWSAYWMIKISIYIITFFAIITLIQFGVYDYKNGGTLTDQILDNYLQGPRYLGIGWDYFIEFLDWIDTL